MVSRLWFLYFVLSIGLLGTVTGYALPIPLLIVGLVFPPVYEVGARCLRFGVRLLLWCQPWLHANMDPRLAEFGARKGITVSNHRSHFDMFLLLSQVTALSSPVKASLFFILPITPLLLLLRMIPVRRRNLPSYIRAVDRLVERAKYGAHVHFFPEMTRCPEGTPGTLEFHLFPFHSIRQAGLEIHPVVFHGTDKVWPKGKVCLRPGQQVTVRVLPALDSKKFDSAAALRDATQACINEGWHQIENESHK